MRAHTDPSGSLSERKHAIGQLIATLYSDAINFIITHMLIGELLNLDLC